MAGTYHYIASTQKSSGVRAALFVNFTGEPNLVLAKTNRIGVYGFDHETEEVVPKLEIPLHGTILYLSTLDDYKTGRVQLMVVTNPLTLVLLSYEGGKVCTRLSQGLKAKSGRALPDRQMFRRNPSGTALVMQIYADFLFLIQFGWKESGRPILRQVGVNKFDAAKIQEMAFLDENNLFVKESEGVEARLKLWEIVEGVLEPRIEIETEPGYAFMARHQESMVIFSKSRVDIYSSDLQCTGTVLANLGKITAVAPWESEIWILGSERGFVFTFNLSDPSLFVKVLGQTSGISDMVQLTPNLIFAGSKMGHHKILRLSKEGEELQEVRTFDNLGAVVDISMTELEKHSEAILWSGLRHDSSLKIVRKGITPKKEATVSVPHIQGVFSLKGPSGWYEWLIVSTIASTLVLKWTEGMFVTQTHTGISLDSESVLVASQENRVLQFVRGDVRELQPETLELVTQTSSEGKILQASVSETHWAYINSSGQLQTDSGLEWKAPSEEISWIDCSEFFILAGTWNAFHIYLLNHNLEVLHVQDIGYSVMIKGITLTTIDSQFQILVGLGDGYLISYKLEDTNFLDKRMTLIGNYPISFFDLQFKGAKNTFLSGDSPAIMYEHNRKSYLCNFITDPIDSITSFQTSEYPNGAVIVSLGSLNLISIEDIRKIGFSEIPMGMSARRAVVVEHYIVVLTEQSKAGHELHVFDMITHNAIDMQVLDPDERGLVLLSVDDIIVLGCEVVKTDGSDPNQGVLRFYKVKANVLHIQTEVETEGPVYSIASLAPGILVTGNGNHVTVWEYSCSELDMTLQEIGLGYVPTAALCISVWDGRYVAVGDAIKAVCLYVWARSALNLIARSPISMFSTSIQMIGDSKVLLGDMFQNIVVLERSHDRMLITSSFYYGEQISDIRSGSLSAYPVDLEILSSHIFSTAQGTLGSIIGLSNKLYHKLESVQYVMSQNIPVAGKLSLEVYRTRKNERREEKEWKNFIDGDYVETFLEQPLEIQLMVCSRTELQLEWLIHVLQALNKLH